MELNPFEIKCPKCGYTGYASNEFIDDIRFYMSNKNDLQIYCGSCDHFQKAEYLKLSD